MNSLKKGHISIELVCVVLGFLISFQYRISTEQQQALPRQRVEELASRLLDVERERDDLRAEVAQLTDEMTSKASAVDSKALTDMRFRAGMVPLTGPGVIVTIDDSKAKVKSDENQNLYLIHDDDLLRVINELRAAGAEAVSVNGQRLVGTSEIRCAGPTLSVNNVRSAPPYEIHAIGDIQTLESAIKMRGGVAETLGVWGITLNVTSSENVEVPAYQGNTSYKYARAAEGASS